MKLQYDETLSNFALKFSLRRYTKAEVRLMARRCAHKWTQAAAAQAATKVRRCRLTVSKPVLKAPVVQRLKP